MVQGIKYLDNIFFSGKRPKHFISSFSFWKHNEFHFFLSQKSRFNQFFRSKERVLKLFQFKYQVSNVKVTSGENLNLFFYTFKQKLFCLIWPLSFLLRRTSTISLALIDYQISAAQSQKYALHKKTSEKYSIELLTKDWRALGFFSR